MAFELNATIDSVVSSIWVAGPMLLVLLVGIFFLAIFWLWSTKRGPFYWRGAIPAPIVICREGNQNVGLPSGDKFRRSREGGVEWLESKTFGDKFPAAYLLQYLVYKRAGKKEYAEFLPLARAGTKMWGSWDFTWFDENAKDQNGKAMLNPDDVVKSNEGIPLMVQAVNQYYTQNFLQQIAPYAVFALAVVGMIVVTLITIQFLQASISTYIGALTASTDAQIKLTNAIMNMTAGGTLIPPPA